MNLHRPNFHVITVAGTNGKGSTVAMLEGILLAAGYKVGAYTSPHLITYNERVRLNGCPVSDDALCEAFERIESGRGETRLTYFEYGTAAAIALFTDAAMDIALLEVGMGGRLDAVNALDAHVAVVTRVGIDHTAWLGADRESIGREKAGIFRTRRPAICTDPQPPATIAETARRTGARLMQLGRDFHVELGDGGWALRYGTRIRAGLPAPAMRGDHQLSNAAAALMALEMLSESFPVSQAHVRRGLLEAVLPGRFQTLPGVPLRILDVAHNPQAAEALAATLKLHPVSGKTLGVLGMLIDKPVQAVLEAVSPVVDRWYPATLAAPRGATAGQLAAAMSAAGITAVKDSYESIMSAYLSACDDAGPADRIVVFGSFYTVSDILQLTAK